MNNQEVFNKVAAHLLKQMAVSREAANPAGVIGPMACLYRGPNGLKCAIGCLIPDELYKIEFDHPPPRLGSSAINEMCQYDSFKEVMAFLQINTESEVDFLSRLQDLHDRVEPMYWHDKLKSFALAEGLEFAHE